MGAPSSAIAVLACGCRRPTGPRPPGSGRSRRLGRSKALNYRHHFHAGNFADLLKHALLLATLARLQAESTPLEVLDTHAGAGGYDLEGEAARRSGEAAAGIARLMEAPDPPRAFAPLIEAVRRQNKPGEVRIYPGSPLLAAAQLRPQDRYLGCELRPDDEAALAEALRPYRNARAARQDGYEALAGARVRPGERRLVLVDPPFERGDDYRRTAETVGAASRRRPEDAFLIWTPIKDLETFDAFLGALIAAGAASGLVAEARVKPLDNPLRMNGCAVTLIGPPGLLDSLAAPAGAIAGWIVERLGEPGAQAQIEPLA